MFDVSVQHTHFYVIEKEETVPLTVTDERELVPAAWSF